MKEQWQEDFDAAFANYIAMSNALGADIAALLAEETDSQSSRRNFVRAAAALVEGYTHCFRDLCQVGLKTGAGPLSADEEKVLTSEQAFGSIKRTKLSIRATYKLFQLPTVPDFGVPEWEQAKLLFEKRDRLMHPKNAADLEVPDDQNRSIYLGVRWLFRHLFSFMEQLAEAHGAKAQQ